VGRETASTKNKNTDGYIYIDEYETKLIKSLIRQYYYGIQAKKELYYKMVEFGELK
jgi:hypothetical protein